MVGHTDTWSKWLTVVAKTYSGVQGCVWAGHSKGLLPRAALIAGRSRCRGRGMGNISDASINRPCSSTLPLLFVIIHHRPFSCSAANSTTTSVCKQAAREGGTTRWEVGGGRWEVGGGRWEVGGGRWEVGGTWPSFHSFTPRNGQPSRNKPAQKQGTG